MRIAFVLAVFTAVTGSTNVTVRLAADSADMSAPTGGVLQEGRGAEPAGKPGVVEEEEDAVEEVMATGELNPSHYPAQRAAKVVQHYLNTRYGSPHKRFGLYMVHKGTAQDVEGPGRKYQLEISVEEMVGNTKVTCSAEVFFPREQAQHAPQVQASCEGLQTIDSTAQDEALYRQYKTNHNLLSAHNLPDSHGNIEPDMKPLWDLGAVASSFVMLNESTEETLYNMAQVANVTQLATEDDQLKFDYHVLLHEMRSQAILPWQLLISWSPAEGVKVLQMKKLPRCHECETPPNMN